MTDYPAATVACFDATCGALPRRELDEPRTIGFLEALARAGAPAVLIAASTGHGHLRTIEELQQWFRCAARAELGSTKKMALLRPEDGLQANCQLLDDLQALRYDVIFVRPGTDLPAGASDHEVAANLRPIISQAARRALPVGIYSIPDVSGLPLTANAAALLLAGEGGEAIVAAKITEADYEASTLRYLADERLARLKIVQGWDPHISRALQDGPRFDRQGRQRCGITSGPMSLAIHQYLHMLTAAERADWPEVTAAQQAVSALFAAMQDDPRRFADLQRAKYIMGLGHPLKGQVTEDQVQRVFEALRALPRATDRARLARSLDLLGDGPFHQQLQQLQADAHM